jgi:hypothetical protein
VKAQTGAANLNMSKRFELLLPDGSEQILSGDAEKTVFSLIQKFGAENWPDLMVIRGEDDDAGWLQLFANEKYGWLVVCCGDDDTLEHFLVEGDSKEDVEVKIASLIDKYKRRQFVRYELAVTAIVEFLRSGNRLVSMNWEEIGG